jgi:hypothetical protein
MKLHFASASCESPSYFLISRQAGSNPSKDYRGGVVHDLKNTFRKYAQQDSTKVGLNSSFAQLVSLVIGEPLSVSSKSTYLDAQLAIIEHFKSAPSNWSTAEAEAPSDEQVRVAKLALITIMINSIPVPKVMLLDGGTIGAYWRRDDQYASIDFDQDGEYPWTFANGLTLRSGIWIQSQPFPEELRTAVSG